MLQVLKKRGGYYCVFQKGDQWFHASMVDTFDHGPECLIFPCDKYGVISDWSEVDGGRFDLVSEESLLQTIERFLSK